MNRAGLAHVTRSRAVAAAAALASCLAVTRAESASFRDALDDFAIDIEQAGASECITHPRAQWDREACEGLAHEPSPAPAEGSLQGVPHPVGAATFRAAKWGFRVMVTRVESSAAAEWDDAIGEAFVSALRKASLEMPRGAELLDGAETAKWDLRAMVGTHVARVACTFREADEPLRKIDYAIAARHGTYRVTFVAPLGHAAELGALAERAVSTVRVTPPDTPRPRAVVIVLFTACVALLGAGASVFAALLLRRRRRRRAR